MDADDAHRQQLLEGQALGTDGGQRIVPFRLAAFGNGFTHFARMLAVEGHGHACAEAVDLGILDEHFHPCDPLQHSPMPATQVEEGTENENQAKESHAGVFDVVGLGVNRQLKTSTGAISGSTRGGRGCGRGGCLRWGRGGDEGFLQEVGGGVGQAMVGDAGRKIRVVGVTAVEPNSKGRNSNGQSSSNDSLQVIGNAEQLWRFASFAQQRIHPRAQH